MITDSGGVVKGTSDHLPFGEDGGVSSESEKHRFTSYERDSETGSDYAINRQYSQGTARFTRPDPVQGSIAYPQSLNRYSYVAGNPVNATDRLGLIRDDWIWGWAGFQLLGGTNVTLDGGSVPVYMLGYVAHLWARGAADIDFPGRTLFYQLPEWYRKEYNLTNPNDFWRLLPIGFGVGLDAFVLFFGQQKPPCPPVPAHPATADIDKNIADAIRQKELSNKAANEGAVASGAVTAALWFESMVRNKGPWDYKQQGSQYQDFGNFNYGATGLAVGFSERTLLREAGRAQQAAGTSKPEWGYPGSRLNPVGGKAPYGDDPADQAQIEKGFEYYKAKMKGCQ